jgi:DNA polymerase-1
MRTLAIDSETERFRPGCMAPRPVCFTWQRPGVEAKIVHASDARPLLLDWLRDPETLFTGAHIAYDFAVIGAAHPDLLPLIFAAYENDRVTDVQVRQKLLDIASGCYRGRIGERGKWLAYEYGLDALSLRCAGIRLQKDAWRMSYGEFLDVPMSRWTERAKELQARASERLAAGGLDEKEAKGLQEMVDGDASRCTEYPLDDARATLAVHQAQEKHAHPYLADQYRQARAAWWLYLNSVWGLRTDAEGVATLRRETQASLDEVEADLIETGLVRPDGTRDTKAAARRMVEIMAREKRPLRRTASHRFECAALESLANGMADEPCHVCLDAEACQASEDPTLIDYAEYSTLKKVLSNDIPALEGGITYPVHPRYDLADTGRTTCSRPNIQNLRRKAGIREAFVPRPGRVFGVADYPQLELYTLAQCCARWIGKSRLAEALNAGLDPHLALAATILRTTYAEASSRHEAGDVEVDDVRQLAKKANFGLPGGMGIARFHLIVKKDLKPEQVARLLGDSSDAQVARLQQLKEEWFATWPEMRAYFQRVSGLCETSTGTAVVETLFTKRIRGGAYYCAACNNGFQALGADCAKEAGFRIARAMYVEGGNPLFGSRTVAFVHDEFVIEADEAKAHDAAHELARLMVEGANAYLPDVPIPMSKMKPVLMRRWSKKAKQVFVEGRLVPWEKS